jgi:hypothetical protein
MSAIEAKLELDKMNEEIAHYTLRESQLSMKLYRAEELLSYLKNEVERLNECNSGLIDQINVRDSTVETLTAEIERNKGERFAFVNRMNEIEDYYKSCLQTASNNLEFKDNEYRRDKKIFEEIKSNFLERISESETRIVELESEIEILRSVKGIDLVEKATSDTKRKLSTAEQLILSLKRELAMKDEELSSFSKDLEKKDTENELLARSKELSTAKKELSVFMTEAEQLFMENQFLRKLSQIPLDVVIDVDKLGLSKAFKTEDDKYGIRKPVLSVQPIPRVFILSRRAEPQVIAPGIVEREQTLESFSKREKDAELLCLLDALNRALSYCLTESSDPETPETRVRYRNNHAATISHYKVLQSARRIVSITASFNHLLVIPKIVTKCVPDVEHLYFLSIPAGNNQATNAIAWNSHMQTMQTERDEAYYEMNRIKDSVLILKEDLTEAKLIEERMRKREVENVAKLESAEARIKDALAENEKLALNLLKCQDELYSLQRTVTEQNSMARQKDVDLQISRSKVQALERILLDITDQKETTSITSWEDEDLFHIVRTLRKKNANLEAKLREIVDMSPQEKETDYRKYQVKLKKQNDLLLEARRIIEAAKITEQKYNTLMRENVEYREELRYLHDEAFWNDIDATRSKAETYHKLFQLWKPVIVEIAPHLLPGEI